MMMKRWGVVFAGGIVVAATGVAWASGLPMAESWEWTRDGARIINSLVVLGGAGYLAVKFGAPIFRRRAEMIAERYETLEMAQSVAGQRMRESQEKLAKIEVDVKKIMDEARAEGEMLRTKIIQQAEETAKFIIEKAEEQVALETEKAREKLRIETTRAAIDMAEAMLKKTIGPEDQRRFVNSYISGMERIGN